MSNHERAELWQKLITLAYMARDTEKAGYVADPQILANAKGLLADLGAGA